MHKLNQREQNRYDEKFGRPGKMCEPDLPWQKPAIDWAADANHRAEQAGVLNQPNLTVRQGFMEIPWVVGLLGRK